jgi:hypothetical protein
LLLNISPKWQFYKLYTGFYRGKPEMRRKSKKSPDPHLTIAKVKDIV